MARTLKTGRLFAAILQFAVFVIYMFPLFWIVITSLNHDINSLAKPPVLFSELTLENYKNVFNSMGLTQKFENSVIIASVSSLVALITGVPAAYVLSRFKFKGNRFLYFSFLIARITPVMSIVLPIYIFARLVHLYDTLFLMIAVNFATNIAWAVWMMKTFFDDIPKSIDEAALSDGCGKMSCLFRIILPLSLPGLFATSIFCIIESWNEYLFTLVLTAIRAPNLIAILNTFISVYGIKWGQMCAASCMIMLPVFCFVIFAQRYIIKGFSIGSIN